MTSACPSYLDKIVNPNLALAAMNSAEPHGEFKAYVKLATSQQQPTSLKMVELYAPGVFTARIPCNRIEDIAADTNVVSIEIREYISSSQDND